MTSIDIGGFFQEPRTNPICDENYFLNSFSLNSPPRSECAWVGKRALSWARWIPGLSNSPKHSLLDNYNLEFSHQHIFIGDKSENIGWGERGLFAEHPEKSKYLFDSTCYDGQLMRRAISSIQVIKKYNPFTNNCQKFVEQILNRYNELLKTF